MDSNNQTPDQKRTTTPTNVECIDLSSNDSDDGSVKNHRSTPLNTENQSVASTQVVDPAHSVLLPITTSNIGESSSTDVPARDMRDFTHPVLLPSLPIQTTTTPSEDTTINQSQQQGSAGIPGEKQLEKDAERDPVIPLSPRSSHTLVVSDRDTNMEAVSSHSPPPYSTPPTDSENGNGSRNGASSQRQKRKRKQSTAPMQTRSKSAAMNDMAQNTRVDPSWQRGMQLGMELFTHNLTEDGFTIVQQNGAFNNIGIGKVKIEADYIPPTTEIKTEIPEVRDSDITDIESEDDDDELVDNTH